MTALPAPTEAAIHAVNDACYEQLVEVCDLAGSYARSASEAAWRCDQFELGIHLRQLRLTTIAALQTFNELGTDTGGEKANAA
jgi:hypothetical protein